MLQRISDSPWTKVILSAMQAIATVIVALLGYIWVDQRDESTKQQNNLTIELREIRGIVEAWRGERLLVSQKVLDLERFREDSMRVREQRGAEISNLRERIAILEARTGFRFEK